MHKAVLIDTHILIWAAEEPLKLPAIARDLFTSRGQIFVSVASYWEIAIKCSQGQLHIGWDFETSMRELGLDLLPITLTHCKSVSQLPQQDRHRDPFDRMIIAQAISDGLPVVTVDRQFDSYGIEIVR